MNVTLGAADIRALALNAAGNAAAGVGPTISNVETININIDAFSGNHGAAVIAATLDARNISAGTEVTIGSDVPGFDGIAGIAAARGINATAGNQVQQFIVSGLSNGTVDAESARALYVTGDNARTDTLRIKVNSDVVFSTLEDPAIRNAVIESTANATIDIRSTSIPAAAVGNANVTGNASAGGGLGTAIGYSAVNLDGLITTIGAGNLTIRGRAPELTGRNLSHEGEGTLTLRVDSTQDADTVLANLAAAAVPNSVLDLTNYSGVDNLVLTPNGATGADEVVTLHSGMTVSTRPGVQSYNGVTLNNAEGNVGRIQGSELNVVLGGNGSGAITLGGFQTVNFTQSSSQTVGVITQNLAGAVATGVVAGTTTLNFSGAGDLNLGTTLAAVAGTNGTDVIDASGIRGGFTYTAPAQAQKVLGSQGTAVITTNDTGQLDYTGQNGGDTINASLTTGTLSLRTGSGNDQLRINEATAAGVIDATPLTTGVVSARLGGGDDIVLVGLNAASGVATGANPAAQAILVGTDGARVVLDAGEGTDVLRLANGVNLLGLGGVTASVNGNLSQVTSSVSGFERIELQEGNGARVAAGANPIIVTAGSFLLNNSTATVAIRYGLDGAAPPARFTVDDAAAPSRLVLNDNLGNSATGRNIDLSGVQFDITRLVDQLVINTGNGNDTIVAPDTLAGQLVRIDSGGGTDRITVGDGPGITNVILGAGSKTVDLSNAAASNVLVFANGTGVAATAATASGVHNIIGWKPQTLIDLEAFAVAPAGPFGAGAAALGVLGTQAAHTTDSITVISTTGAAANLTLEGSAVITDFRSAEQVANYLGERYTTTATNQGVFVLNDTRAGSDMSYIWLYSEVALGGIAGAGDTAFAAADFQLLATVENGGVGLTTANFTAIDQAAAILAGAAAPTVNIWI